jgi:hypothetical protein
MNEGNAAKSKVIREAKAVLAEAKDQANEQASCSPQQCVVQTTTEGSGPQNLARSDAGLDAAIARIEREYNRRHAAWIKRRDNSEPYTKEDDIEHHKLSGYWEAMQLLK